MYHNLTHQCLEVMVTFLGAGLKILRPTAIGPSAMICVTCATCEPMSRPERQQTSSEERLAKCPTVGFTHRCIRVLRWIPVKIPELRTPQAKLKACSKLCFQHFNTLQYNMILRFIYSIKKTRVHLGCSMEQYFNIKYGHKTGTIYCR